MPEQIIRFPLQQCLERMSDAASLRHIPIRFLPKINMHPSDTFQYASIPCASLCAPCSVALHVTARCFSVPARCFSGHPTSEHSMRSQFRCRRIVRSGSGRFPLPDDELGACDGIIIGEHPRVRRRRIMRSQFRRAPCSDTFPSPDDELEARGGIIIRERPWVRRRRTIRERSRVTH